MTTMLRTVLTTALVAVTVLLAAAGPATAAPKARDRATTVATYNIHHGADPAERLDLERIASEIRRGGADVIGLQEVDRHWGARSAFVDQAAWLAERLGLHVVYGANLDLAPAEAGQERRQYGTAVLSRFPILSSRNTLLPRPRNGEQRGLLEAVLNVRGVRVRFANTHLQHNNAEERLAQSQRIVELLGNAPEPTVLVGDLNATPQAPELAPLFAHLDDAWVRAGRGAGFTYPVERPDRRIDYVLVSPDVEVRDAQVIASDASDHLQVTADLAVSGSRVGGAPRKATSASR